MIKDITYPGYLLAHGIRPCAAGFDKTWRVGAGDVETVHGSPYVLQLGFNTGPKIADKDVRVYDVSPATILTTFVDALDEWARRDVVNVVFFHNLRFDLQAILYEYQELFGEEQRDFKVNCWAGVEGQTRVLHAFTEKTWFAKLRLSSRRMVWILDSRAFFLGSLEKAATLVGSPWAKLARPEGIGQRRLSGPVFERYIRNDVLAGWHVGNAIRAWHQEEDIPLSVSTPHIASRVWRRHFFRPDDAIPFPAIPIARAAELAYHGGKNQMSVPPGWYKGVTELDINSAYTSAMAALPSFLDGRFVKVKDVPPVGAHGIVCVSGEVECPYGVLHTHGFKPIHGRFDQVWTTTYELREALDHGEVRLAKCWGWVWSTNVTRSNLRDYALHYWNLKAERAKTQGKNSIGYNTAKLLSNALYGKFMGQVRESKRVEMLPDGRGRVVDIYRATGIYNPVLGSLITGHVRAVLHRAEHLMTSLHSSTDAIKTQSDPRKMGKAIGSGLGQWSIELGPSLCLLLRPKLYIHEPGPNDHDVKAAFHGFNPSPQGHASPTGADPTTRKTSEPWFDNALKMLRKAAGSPDRPGPVLSGRSFAYFKNHCWSHREALKRSDTSVRALDFQLVEKILPPLADAPMFK